MQNKTRIGEVEEYNGKKFYRYPYSSNISHSRYFSPGISDIQKGVELLHRQKWIDVNGPIPDGYEIHHIDFNPLNNSIDNLTAIPISEHRRIHAKNGDYSTDRVISNLNRIRHKTKKWHRSADGREWHKKHGMATFGAKKAVDLVCIECGKTFKSKNPHIAKYCSGACYQMMLRRENRVTLYDKICEFCGESYEAKNKKQRFCSHSCSSRYSHRVRSGI